MHLRNWNREKNVATSHFLYLFMALLFWLSVMTSCNFLTVCRKPAHGTICWSWAWCRSLRKELKLSPTTLPPPTGKKWFNFFFPTCGLFSLTDWFCSSFQWKKKVALIAVRKLPQKWTAADGVVQFRREKKMLSATSLLSLLFISGKLFSYISSILILSNHTANSVHSSWHIIKEICFV